MRRARSCLAPILERLPGRMAHDPHLIEVVHPGSTEGTVRGRKAGRLDDVHLDAEAGGEPQNRPGVLGNVGLVECDRHDAARRPYAIRDGRQNLRQAKDLCDFWSFPRRPTCAPLARVPIKRRRIDRLASCLQLNLQLTVQLTPGMQDDPWDARWRTAGSPAAARRRLRVGGVGGDPRRPACRRARRACASAAVGGPMTRKGLHT